ncbi:hypothetical protein GCM10023200_29800 [Actinomycetospora chlora]|uniref:Uncharacterized protein n=1 Tax=Actinomycetospora chlora TaxID=663608 RepID=A0ABP9B9I4_9PSEU
MLGRTTRRPGAPDPVVRRAGVRPSPGPVITRSKGTARGSSEVPFPLLITTCRGAVGRLWYT